MTLEQTTNLYAQVLRTLLPVGAYDQSSKTTIAQDVYAHAKALAQADLDAKRLLSVLEVIPHDLIEMYELEYGLPLHCTVNTSYSIQERLDLLALIKKQENVINYAYLEMILSVFGVQLDGLVTYKPTTCTANCTQSVNAEYMRYKVVLLVKQPILADMECIIEHYLPAYLQVDWYRDDYSFALAIMSLDATLDHQIIKGKTAGSAKVTAVVDDSLTAQIRADGLQIKGRALPSSKIMIHVES